MDSQTVNAVLRLNRGCFGVDDQYSKRELMRAALSSGHALVERDARGKIIAFNLMQDRGRYIEGLRLCTHRLHRRQGLAHKLLQRSIRYARQLGKGYRAYILASNAASVNAHLRAGMLFDAAAPSGYEDNPRLWFYITPDRYTCRPRCRGNTRRAA